MFTQELVTSIIAEQEESTDQFVDIIQQKIEDAIEVKRIELASQMFEASKKCPECGKADCECDDEEDEDEEEDDEEEMKEEVEQVDESNLGLRSLYSTDPKKQPFYKTQKGRDTAAKKNIPALKGQIKSTLGRHPKPNLPEEAEQVNELKKSTLASYIPKASKERGWAGIAAGSSAEKSKEQKDYLRIMGKRQKGIERATSKLAKEEVEQIDEVSYSAKAARAGKDIGKPGKNFAKIAASAAKKYGSKEAGNRVAGAILKKLRMKEDVNQVDEMAPPGAKYERMVKHIKKGYSKGGLTKNEKSIAYATAWKAKGREMNEAAMTDAQKMAALGMKGAEKAKTMMALSSYRKHGDINKLSAGHRSLVSSYMEKTGGLEAVNRSAATQALKKERMQEE